MDDTLTAVALVRDVVFISLLLVGPIVGFLLYRKVKSFVDSTRRTIETTSGLVTVISDTFRKPPPERRGFASRFGRLLLSVAGRNGKGRKEA